ncbi:unnamed protein product [Amoebophrya sp. A25]|nr:unnamed protein product [Amoebophrya sp. A25]|eukprot:GSA25T00021747001.1
MVHKKKSPHCGRVAAIAIRYMWEDFKTTHIHIVVIHHFRTDVGSWCDNSTFYVALDAEALLILFTTKTNCIQGGSVCPTPLLVRRTLRKTCNCNCNCLLLVNLQAWSSNMQWALLRCLPQKMKKEENGSLHCSSRSSIFILNRNSLQFEMDCIVDTRMILSFKRSYRMLVRNA